MPMRNFTVNGTSPAAFADSRTIASNSFRLYGSAAPPPLRVTFATGQPKLLSTWSARPSPTMIRTASAMVFGSTP